jgi:ubiquinone/menaquinone biosynthesis C-methylase UbiE/glycosyltransferase involved in cell wall biosynthesis
MGFQRIKEPLVSVLIPTENSEATIGKCLDSIKNQTCPNIEIIVVDCFSKDKTKEIAEDYKARIFESEAKRSEARNIGSEKANGDLVVFVDSDMELSSSVIEECVRKVKEGYHGAIIPEISIGQGFWAKCKALEKTCYMGDDSIEAARFFVKSAFESVGGYDCELEAGEDWDLNHRMRRSGYKIGRIDAFIAHHEGKLRLRETMLKKRHYGKTLGRYKRKHPNEAKQQLRLIRPAFTKNWRRLARDPVHALGILFMKTCEFLALTNSGSVTRLDPLKEYFRKPGTVEKWWKPEENGEHTLEKYRPYYVRERLDVVRLSKPQGRTVLDVGTGRGRFPISFLLSGAKEVVAVDLSGEMIKVAKEEGEKAGITEKITWCICDAEHLPFRDAPFDIVCCIQTFPHLPSPQKAMDELARVGKIGCLVVVDAMVYGTLRKLLVKFLYYKYNAPLRRLVQLFVGKPLKRLEYQSTPIVKIYSKNQFLSMFRTSNLRINRCQRYSIFLLVLSTRVLS